MYKNLKSKSDSSMSCHIDIVSLLPPSFFLFFFSFCFFFLSQNPTVELFFLYTIKIHYNLPLKIHFSFEFLLGPNVQLSVDSCILYVNILFKINTYSFADLQSKMWKTVLLDPRRMVPPICVFEPCL